MDLFSKEKMRELSTFSSRKFANAFERWFNEVLYIVAPRFQRHARLYGFQMKYSIGRRYVKVKHGDTAYGFIDKEGNVLYPACWSKPAQHIRGSIHNKNCHADGAGVLSVWTMKEMLLERRRLRDVVNDAEREKGP